MRAAEARLHAASAQVGVAVADRLPQFSLDATWCGAASHIGRMFWSSGRFFDLAGNVTQWPRETTASNSAGRPLNAP